MAPVSIDCQPLTAVAWRPAGAWVAGAAVDVFAIRVSRFERHLGRLLALLSEPEAARAARYYRPADQHRFVVARALRRVLLGRLVGQAAREVQFEGLPNHKPTLAGADIRFSASGSADWALLVVSAAEVGVDVEWVDAGFAFQAVLASVCTTEEQARIRRGPDSRQLFYEAWTRKEALVKATGQGIDDNFARLSVLDGSRRTSMPGAAEPLAVRSFWVAEAYLAALAYPARLSAGEFGFYQVDESILRGM